MCVTYSGKHGTRLYPSKLCKFQQPDTNTIQIAYIQNTAHPIRACSASSSHDTRIANRSSTWRIEDLGICTRRGGRLYKARSRLYRSQILRVNSKNSLESSRDLQNALLCTVLESTIENWGKKNLAKTTPKR